MQVDEFGEPNSKSVKLYTLQNLEDSTLSYSELSVQPVEWNRAYPEVHIRYCARRAVRSLSPNTWISLRSHSKTDHAFIV